MALPITVACAIFAEDIVRVLLGPQWHAAASVFRLLAPTIVAFALINPFGWVLFANGRVGRSLRIALVIAPVTILACVLGLPHGPTGVAIGFSTAMVLLVAPVVFWAKEGTLITARDTFGAILPPACSVLAGAGLVAVLWPWLSEISWPLLRLAASCGAMFGAYLAVLLLPFGQGRIYVNLLRDTGLWPARWSNAATRGH